MATNVQVSIVKIGDDVLSTHVPVPSGESPVSAQVIASVSGDSVESSISIPTDIGNWAVVVNASALGTEDVFVTMDGTTASATAGHMVSPGQLRAFRVTEVMLGHTIQVFAV